MIDGALCLARVRLARAARDEARLRRLYLHPDEERLAAQLRVDKRRTDFVAGRVAIKRAARRLGLPGRPSEIAVLPDQGYRAGAPVLFDRERLRRREPVSISHAAGFAYAAAATRGRLGLDVERIEPREASFAEGAFAPGEVARWAAALGRSRGEAPIVTIAWCAKEALLKLAGVGLRAPLESHAVQSIRWESTPPPPEAWRLDAGALAWAEIETLELGVASLGVATQRDVALVVVWSSAPAR